MTPAEKEIIDLAVLLSEVGNDPRDKDALLVSISEAVAARDRGW